MTDRVPLDKDSAPGEEDGPMPSVLPDDEDPRLPGLTSESRKWWWITRASHCGLLWVPAIPLVHGVTEFLEPSASIRLTDRQQDAVNAVVHLDNGADVHGVSVVLGDPTWAERLMASAPSVLLALMLGGLSYALWRIEVNMTAGPHQRPFTAKDERWLKRAAGSTFAFWAVFVALEFGGIKALGLGRSGSHLGPVGDLSLAVLWLSFLTATFARVYSKGRKAYTELEKIV